MAAQNDKSSHILNASSNLLALCFIVLTSLKLLRVTQKSLIDELTTTAIIFFMMSCILSFLSIRGNKKWSGKYENIADYIFLAGLFVFYHHALVCIQYYYLILQEN